MKYKNHEFDTFGDYDSMLGAPPLGQPSGNAQKSVSLSLQFAVISFRKLRPHFAGAENCPSRLPYLLRMRSYSRDIFIVFSNIKRSLSSAWQSRLKLAVQKKSIIVVVSRRT